MKHPAEGVGFCANSGIATLHATNLKSCIKVPTTIESEDVNVTTVDVGRYQNSDVNDSAVGVGLCASSGIATLRADKNSSDATLPAMPMVPQKLRDNYTTNCGDGGVAAVDCVVLPVALPGPNSKSCSKIP